MQTMKLGEVTISRVIEIDRSSFPTASMLPRSSADVIAGHHRWLKPHFFDESTGDHVDVRRTMRASLETGGVESGNSMFSMTRRLVITIARSSTF